MLVDADGARASVGAGVEFRDAADGDAGLRYGVLGEGPYLVEHTLGSAHALADEDLVGALLPPARRLEALLLVAAALDADKLTRHQRRDRRAQQRPPRVHHRLASLRENRCCTIRFDRNPRGHREIVRQGEERGGELGVTPWDGLSVCRHVVARGREARSRKRAARALGEDALLPLFSSNLFCGEGDDGG